MIDAATSPQSNTLAETALAFAHECMRWDDCRLVSSLNVWTIFGYPLGSDRTAKEGWRVFRLDDVLPSVCAWADSTGLHFEINYSPKQSGFGVLCNGIDTWSPDPCHALLAACVAASRKLREVA